jgi:hypothetical protein
MHSIIWFWLSLFFLRCHNIWHKLIRRIFFSCWAVSRMLEQSLLNEVCLRKYISIL